MPRAAITVASLGMFLFFAMGAAFLIAPNKANELFGTYITRRENSFNLRVLGLLFMIFALLFEGAMVGGFLK